MLSLWFFSEHCPRFQEDMMTRGADAWGRLGPSGTATHPVLLFREEGDTGYLLQEKDLEPWINVCIGSTRKQRILGYLKARSAQANRPGLSLWPRGLTWLRPALCQPIMSDEPDGRKDSLPSDSRISIKTQKNLRGCYGCWTWLQQQPLGFLISAKGACSFF